MSELEERVYGLEQRCQDLLTEALSGEEGYISVIEKLGGLDLEFEREPRDFREFVASRGLPIQYCRETQLLRAIAKKIMPSNYEWVIREIFGANPVVIVTAIKWKYRG